MKNEILQTIASVIGALNNTEVKGKQNLMNLAGAIGILEDLGNKIAAQDEAEDRPAPPAKEES